VPHTISRDLWYADAGFMRRNRQNGPGTHLIAGHALEVHVGDRYGCLTTQQLEANPDWNAEIGGKRSINGRFCWANHEVSAAVAEGVIAQLDQTRAKTLSLAPEDSSNFCECEKCKALDAGDWDPSMNQISITDRFVHFANRVATRVVQKLLADLPATSEIYCVGILPRVDISAETLKPWRDIIRTSAAEVGEPRVRYVDPTPWRMDGPEAKDYTTNFADGVHLNATGMAVLAEQLQRVIAASDAKLQAPEKQGGN